MEALLESLSPQLRLLLSAVTALAIVLFSGVYFLPLLHRLKYGQSIREEGPASHQQKSGTPTMGGVMIVLAVTAATLLFAPLTVTTLLALFIFVALPAIVMVIAGILVLGAIVSLIGRGRIMSWLVRRLYGR